MGRVAPANNARLPLLLPVLLVATGVALLLGDFLLFNGFSTASIGFILIVILGIIILLRGDMTFSSGARTFGITRGSVESATLIINASDIDIHLQPLTSPERLIAGQYAPTARPELRVDGNHATLTLDRAHTSVLNNADWEVSLAQQMPWTLLCSASLGQIDADCSSLILQTAALSSGFGAIRLVPPVELLGQPVYVKSVLGNIHIQTPTGYNVQVTAPTGLFFRVFADSARYLALDATTYLARDPAPEAPLVTIHVSGSFGDAYLS